MKVLSRSVEQKTNTYEATDPHDVSLLALADTAHADHQVADDKQSGLLSRRLGSATVLTTAAICEVIR